jgi:hypothetical protein
MTESDQDPERIGLAPCIRIRIKVKSWSWIRIRIETKTLDSSIVCFRFRTELCTHRFAGSGSKFLKGLSHGMDLTFGDMYG